MLPCSLLVTPNLVCIYGTGYSLWHHLSCFQLYRSSISRNKVWEKFGKFLHYTQEEIPYPPIYPVVPEAKLFLQPFSQVNNGPCTFPLTAIKLRQPPLCLTSSLFITPSPRCTSLQHVYSGLPLIWLECKPLSHECMDLPDQLISGHSAEIKDLMRLWANAFALLYTIRTIQDFGERKFWNTKNWWI